MLYTVNHPRICLLQRKEPHVRERVLVMYFAFQTPLTMYTCICITTLEHYTDASPLYDYKFLTRLSCQEAMCIYR